MNNVTNSIPLHKIVIPELTSAEFASGLQSAFININKNFALLANADFVKGESGESVKIQDNSFFNEDGSINTLGLKLKACIENGVSDELIDVHYTDENDVAHTISVWDNFTPDTAGTIQMIYSQVNDNTSPAPVSSLYYVFLDARYANNVIGTITRDDEHASQYANLKDMSCILVYDKDVSVTIEQDGNNYTVNGGFRMLTNAFPTVYYESGIGLCWKINGANTGIPVQGLPGRDGKNAITSIVKCSNVEKSEYNIIFGEVTHIHNNFNGYQSIDSIADITKYNNNAALVLVTENSTNTGFDCGFYFGQLKIENGKLYAYCDQQNAINHGLSTQAVIDAMKSIDINNNGVNTSEGMKGLYIPIRQVDNEGVQPIHIISATNFSDSTGDSTSGDKSDIIFTAIDNINSFDSDATLLVNKYLYVRLNPECDAIEKTILNSNSTLSGYNYVLKYKLANVVNNANSNYLGVYDDTNSVGGRYIGNSVKLNDGSDSKVNLLSNQNKIRYYKYGTPNATDTEVIYSENHLDSMPGIFKDRLTVDNGDTNKHGIYRWVLCDDFHDFDVTDLKNAPANTKNGDKYIFPTELKTIFTDTITPGEDTKFLWFNGILLAGSNNLGITIEDKYDININGIIEDSGDGTPGSKNTYYVVPGWCPMDNEWDSLFSFVKFIPVYENSMKYTGDTALNLNYNVNIGGTTDEHEKSITVNGKVNCNDLNVYNLTAAGEIKHIYTKDTIVGDDGIKLGVIVDDGNIQGYNTTIDNSGNISINGDIHTPVLNTDKNTGNISIENNIIAKKSVTNGLEINSLSGNNHIYIGNIGDESDIKLGIEVKDINSISINRTDLQDDIDDNTRINSIPKIINNTPVINYDKTNVIVTNGDPASNLLQYYGNVLDTDGNTVNHTSPTKTTGNFDEIFDANILAIDHSGNIQNAFKKDAKTVDYTINDTSLETIRKKISEIGGANNNNVAAGRVDRISSTTELKIASTNNVSKNTICNFTISRPEVTEANNGETVKLNSNDNIVVQFNSKYLVRMCCIGECSNGYRPYINSSSKLTLKVLYKQSGMPTFTEISALAKTYTFNDTRWYGYDINGKSIESYSKGDRYDSRFRYYDFVFKPKDITISNGTEAFAQICNIFNSGKDVDICIVADYDVQFISEKSTKKVIQGGYVYLPIPIASEINSAGVDNNTTVDADKLVLSVNEFNNYKNATLNKFNSNPAKLLYSTSTGSASDYTNTTTLCNDGIVVCSANNQTTHIFGLGMKQHTYSYTTSDGGVTSTNELEYRPVLRYYRKSKGAADQSFNQDKFIDLTSLFDHLSNDLIYNSDELITHS